MAACKNCEEKFEGNFCPNCGQKVIEKRFQLNDSIRWLLSSIFNLEQGFFFTTKELILRPGYVIKSFLNGATKNYVHPFRYIFVWASISTIFALYFDLYGQTGMQANDMIFQSQKQHEVAEKMMGIFNQLWSFIILAFIPFWSLASYWISYKSKMNYTEHLIIMSFGVGTITAVGIPIILLLLFVDSIHLVNSINILIGALILGRLFAQTFGNNLFIGILKYLFSILIGMFLILIFFIAIFFIGALVFKSLGLGNPFQ